MSFVLLVLSIMLTVGLSVARKQFHNEYEKVLYAELNVEMHSQRKPFRENNSMHLRSGKLSFSVMNMQGEWKLLTPWIEIEEDTLQTLIKKATAEKNDIGFWKDSYLAYAKKQNKISFVDFTTEYQAYISYIYTWVIVYILAIIFFIILSVLLSNWAIRPIEQAWKTQKRFLSDASHELKTPLSVILSNLEIAQKEIADNRWINVAMNESYYMKKLIENLLFLARNDENKQMIQNEHINISDLLIETALAFEANCFEKEIEFQTEISNDLVMYADANLIRQLFSIFLDNAVKYTPPKHKISISLSKQQDKICFTAENTGVYLIKEQINKLFDRFYRVDDAREKGSYGLGLSIAQKIVELYKGEIKVKSDERKISFQITFNTK